MNLNSNLAAERAIFRLAQLQGAALDAHELHYAVASCGGTADEAPVHLLAAICVRMGFHAAQTLREIDPTALPALVCHPDHGWGVLRGLSGRDTWVAQFFDVAQDQFVEVELQNDESFEAFRLLTSKPFDASHSKVFALIKGEVFQHKSLLLEAAAGGLLINVLMLSASFYSMQVYDRVIPTHAYSTLWVLTVGVLLAMVFEFAARLARSKLMEHVVLRVDGELARKVFARLLSVRMDQLPQSVGSLSAQLRGYEVVRAFVSSTTIYLLVDVPFGLVFIGLIGAIGGVYMALVPLVFLLLSLTLGFYYRDRVERSSERVTQTGIAKMGLLVEVIEGAETIKSGGGGWRMLSHWLKLSDDARTHELSIREMMEHSQYLTLSADAGAIVSVVFTANGQSVSKSINSNGSATAVGLSAADLATLGQGKVDVSATAHSAGQDSASVNTSFVLDTLTPNAPVLLAAAATEGALKALSSAGAITVAAESGASVLVTFAANGQSVSKTLTGSGAAQPVVLTSVDLMVLGQGSVSVSASATDLAGNTSTPGSTSFILDTLAPNAPFHLFVCLVHFL